MKIPAVLFLTLTLLAVLGTAAAAILVPRPVSRCFLQPAYRAPENAKQSSCSLGCRGAACNKVVDKYSHLFKSTNEISEINNCDTTRLSRARRPSDNDRCCPTETLFESYDACQCHPSDYSWNGRCCVVSRADAYQVVHVGRCKKPESSCDNGNGLCSQRYKYVMLLCQPDGSNDLEFRYFSVKSHCRCKSNNIWG